jgi:serine/threonine protein kinase
LQVAEAMEYLHKENVVHGDLKTQNILFSQYDISGDKGSFIVVKVADFGSAQVSV